MFEYSESQYFPVRGRGFPNHDFCHLEGFSGTGGSIPVAAREFKADKTGPAVEKIQHYKGLDSVSMLEAHKVYWVQEPGPTICPSVSCRLFDDWYILYPFQSQANEATQR